VTFVAKSDILFSLLKVCGLKIVTVENYQRNLPEIINLFIVILFII